MTYALTSNPSPLEVSEAVNYLLSNFAIGLTANPNSGQITDPTGNVVGYLYKYIAIKYADSQTGSVNFSNVPTNRLYYGIRNTNNSVESNNPTDYIWNLTTTGFGSNTFLYYLVLGGRQIQFTVATTPPSYKWLIDPGASIDLDFVVPVSTISFNELMDAAVTELKIAASAVTATKINVAALDQASGGLKANTVSAAQIMTDAVTNLKLLDGAVSANKTNIAAIAPLTGLLNSGTVDTTQLVNNAVTGLKLLDGSITAAKTSLAAIESTTGGLTTNSVGTTQITTDAVTSPKIVANAIIAGKIAADAVTANTIAANSITAGKIAADAVTANAIAAGAVVAGKIFAGSIVAGDIAGGTITGDKIFANTITGDKIAANTIGAAAITAGAITAVKIEAGAITSEKIVAGAVTADKVTVSNLSALSANMGSISAGSLNAVNITGSTITGNTITGSTINGGTINGTTINTGTLNGTTGTFSGNLNAVGGTFGGSLSAATGTFSGALSAATGTFSGGLTTSAINAVNTINIAGNAVTVPAGASQVSNITFGSSSAGGGTLLMSVSVDSGGTPIYVMSALTIYGSGNGDSFTVSMLNNGTIIKQFTVTGAGVPAALLRSAFSEYIANPGTGARTLEIRAYSSFEGYAIAGNTLFAIGTKR